MKVLYLAIDGVAPRAKMNQQRARRFRAAREAQVKAAIVRQKHLELAALGQLPVALFERTFHFDPNCITPGTAFMQRVTASIRAYVASRMSTAPAWAGRAVILSDASVPGEGEHKIMEFIRQQRSQPGYDPNTRHVLYGADADLIMLGLLTHEPHFYIMREEYRPPAPRPCDLCGYRGHGPANCKGLAVTHPQSLRGYEPETDPVGHLLIELPLLREVGSVFFDDDVGGFGR